jgi:hypothetical protein
MVHRCEGNLCANFVKEILEHVTVKILGIVNCDLLWDSVTTNDVLPEFFFDCLRGYIGDGLRLDPFHEVFHRHYGEGVVALRWGEFANDVNAPSLQRSGWSDQL